MELSEIEDKKEKESIDKIDINLVSEKIEEKKEEKSNLQKLFEQKKEEKSTEKTNTTETTDEMKDVPKWRLRLHNERKEKILTWAKEFSQNINDITKSWKDGKLITEIIKFYEPKLIKDSEDDLRFSLSELLLPEFNADNFLTEGKSIEFLFKVYTKFIEPEYSSILQKKRIEENKKTRESKIVKEELIDSSNNTIKITNTKTKKLKSIKKGVINILNETETEKKLNDIEDKESNINYIVLKYDSDNINKLMMKGI
jgi:hypothetical protein